MSKKANIFEIKRFGTNDGAGIRTVIFIKGCPLSCKWCHNPEGINLNKGIWRTLGGCISCGLCAKSCKTGAVSAVDGNICVKSELCNFCGACISACPTGAMCFDSKELSTEQLMQEIHKDSVFYRDGGGVTLSGGEPTFSPEFSLELLNRCRAEGINTSIESCLYTSQKIIKEFASCTDSIIADLKLADNQRHKSETGVFNDIIIENIKLLKSLGTQLLVRVPLIPNHTADEENILGIGSLLKGLDIPIELINYNPLCIGKYQSLEREYIEKQPSKLYSKSELEAFRQMLEKQGITAFYK